MKSSEIPILLNCVECLVDGDCPPPADLDPRCESVFCDTTTHICRDEKRPEGVGCAEWSSFYYCYICNNGKCVCNEANFQCETCVPSCGYLKGDSCCPENSQCSIEDLGRTFDCERCCVGQCI